MFFFFQAEDGIRDLTVTGVQTCALPICDPGGAGQCSGPPLCRAARTCTAAARVVMTRVLLAGVSTRGFAESAVRAGYEVVAVDGFGDLDLRACATEVHVVRAGGGGRFSARAAAAAVRHVPCEAAVYEASFENHPSAVRALAANRMLWGNPPAVLARARDPRRLARVVGDAGLPGPHVRLTRPAPGTRSGRPVTPMRPGGCDGSAMF